MTSATTRRKVNGFSRRINNDKTPVINGDVAKITATRPDGINCADQYTTGIFGKRPMEPARYTFQAPGGNSCRRNANQIGNANNKAMTVRPRPAATKLMLSLLH